MAHDGRRELSALPCAFQSLAELPAMINRKLLHRQRHYSSSASTITASGKIWIITTNSHSIRIHFAMDCPGASVNSECAKLLMEHNRPIKNTWLVAIWMTQFVPIINSRSFGKEISSLQIGSWIVLCVAVCIFGFGWSILVDVCLIDV